MNRPRGIVRGQRIGTEKLKRAKQLRREMTPQEVLLWGRVRRNGLQGLHFRRQQVVDGFILDFYCHQAALVVEVDGPIHETQAAYDEERSRWLVARGLRVLRIPNVDVDANLEAVLSRIAAACREQLAGQ
jgi:very-short-patch-repair endonuclease